MPENGSLPRARLKTPKAAAIAGILFSTVMIAIFWLLQPGIPADPLEPGAWLAADPRAVTVALNLVPVAGVAFLWFTGVLRDRLGQQEDRFLATVFLGSALAYVAMLFTAAALAGAVILVTSSSSDVDQLTASSSFRFMRATTYIVMNVYATKMAAVFMVSASTFIIYTNIVPRWFAIIGYVLGIGLLVGSRYFSWSFAALPVWVFLMGSYILIDNLRQSLR